MKCHGITDLESGVRAKVTRRGRSTSARAFSLETVRDARGAAYRRMIRWRSSRPVMNQLLALCAAGRTVHFIGVEKTADSHLRGATRL